MKILLVSSSSGSRGGGEIYLLYLGRALAARGHEVTLWASKHARMDELCTLYKPVGPIVRAPYTNTYDFRTRSVASYLSLATSRRLARDWRDLAPDVIHINKQNLEDGLDLLRAATWSGLPSVATIHLTQSARYLRAVLAPLRDLVSRRALRRYPGPIACVLAERERDLRAFLGDSPRFRTIPNGVELYDLTRRAEIRATKRAELGIAPDALLLAAVGRLVQQKRPLLFLDLAQRIHEKLPHAQFVWVGDGQLAAEWDAQVVAQNCAAYVRRIGWQQNVRDFLFAADAFLHTAEFEGLPLAILEALSAALPCVITPNLRAEMPFLTADHAIALDDDSAWAQTLTNPARLAALGRNARALAEEQFSFDLMAQRYEALYREVST
jgi:glycosyltransferase involved in cell wall biosynthesis